MTQRRTRSKFREEPLTDAERSELSDEYWSESDSASRLAARWKLPAHRLPQLVLPRPAPDPCARCGGPSEYRSRSQRKALNPVCNACGHQQRAEACPCGPCKQERELADRLASEDRERQLREQVRRWHERYGTEEYVRWALAQLTPAQRLYLDGVQQAFHRNQGFIYWERIAEECGQSPHHAERWVTLLERYHLLAEFDGAVFLNPALDRIEVIGPPPRRRTHA